MNGTACSWRSASLGLPMFCECSMSTRCVLVLIACSDPLWLYCPCC